MTASGFLVRVIFLAVPGIVSYMLFRKLAGRTKGDKWEEWCKIVLFSLIIYGSYSLLAWLFGCLGWGRGELSFFKAVLDENVAIEWSEIIIASLIGVPVALIAAAIQTYRLVHSLGRLFRVTRRSGDEDVWNYFHNLPNTPKHGWILVRDHKTGLRYYGWICAFSDLGEEGELLMGDVDVYPNDKNDILYKRERLYLCRNRHDLTIETLKPNDKSEEKARDETKEVK